jgi:hypothetical protein
MTNNGPALSASALVLDGLTAGLTLFNATGTTSASAPPAGSPYIETGPIGAGASISVTLQFTRVGSPVVAYTARVLGPGAR